MGYADKRVDEGITTEQSIEEKPTEAKQGGVRYWAPLITVGVAMFIATIDSSMMNVAVPTIVSDLNTDVTAVQGAITFYGLVMASLMLPAGRVATMYGIKRVYAISLLLYGLGTLLAAISWSMAVLFVGWSVIEGIAAAVIIPLAFALVVTSYEGKHRAMALGLIAGVSGAAAALGPIFGGILTTYFTWRWGFGGEFILALVALGFVPFLTEYRDEDQTLDWVGAILSAFGIGTIILGSLLAGRYGLIRATRPFVINDVQVNPLGLSPTVWLVAIGVLLFVGFIRWQLRREARNQTPLVPMRVFRNGAFVAGVSTWVFRSVALAGFLFTIPLFLQSAVDFSAFESGVALLPFSLSVFAFSLWTTDWNERVESKRLIQGGCLILVVGLLFLVTQISTTVTITALIIPMAIIGIGLGLVMAQIVNLTLSTIEKEDVSEASSTLNATGMLGYSVGTALFGSALLSFFYSSVVGGVLEAQGLAASLQEQQQLAIQLEDAKETATTAELNAAIAALPAETQQALNNIVQGAMVSAMELTVLLIAAAALLTFIVALFLPSQEREEVPEELETDANKVVRAD